LPRNPGTPIDETLDPRDRPILQYAYSDQFCAWDSMIHRIFTKFATIFQPSIKQLSLRQAMLAYSSAFAPNSSYEHVERYSSLACQQLIQKTPSTIDEADLFAVFLLTLLSCLYQDASNFRRHLFGFTAIMGELERQASARLINYRMFWLLARDMIVNGSRQVPGVNGMIFEFCHISQPLIGQQRVADRVRYNEELFGPCRPYAPVIASIWNSYCLLRRCLWYALCKHLGNATINSEEMVHSVLAEVKVDNEGKGDEIEAEFRYTTLQQDRDNTVLARLLYRVNKLIIAILEDENIFNGQSPQAIVCAATSVVHFIQSENLTPNSAEVRSKDTIAQRDVRSVLPRILCLVSLGLGDSTIDQECISK
jgi:hypothetical protein